MIRLKIIISIQFVIFIGSSGICQTINDVQKENLSGFVKYIHKETWGAKGTYLQYKLSHKLTFENISLYFDKNSSITSKVLFDTNNTLKDSSLYTYNESGNLLRSNSFNKYGNYQHIEFTYDVDGKLLKKKGFEYDEYFEYTYKYILDSTGKVKRVECYDSLGVVEYITFTYNTKGKIIEQTACYESGSIKSKTKCQYDSIGNVIKELYYNSLSMLASAKYMIPTYYKYNTKNKKTEERGYNSSGNYAYLERYDDNGNKIESYDLFYSYIYDPNGEASISQDYINNTVHDISDTNYTSKLIYTYDSLNREIESYSVNNNYRITKRYDKFGNILTQNDTIWIYEYDNEGNWIKKVQCTKNEVDVVVICEIKYY